MELIDKEKVIKEIKKVYDEGYKFLPSDIVENVDEFKDELLRVLDTLETKEVDFEKEWKEYFKYRGDMATVNIIHLAKHFFELGLNARKGK